MNRWDRDRDRVSFSPSKKKKTKPKDKQKGLNSGNAIRPGKDYKKYSTESVVRSLDFDSDSDILPGSYGPASSSRANGSVLKEVRNCVKTQLTAQQRPKYTQIQASRNNLSTVCGQGSIGTGMGNSQQSSQPYAWGPGEVIHVVSSQDVPSIRGADEECSADGENEFEFSMGGNQTQTLEKLLMSFQRSIENKLHNIDDKLTFFGERLETLEQKTDTGTSTDNSMTTPVNGKRKRQRLTPTAMQSKIRVLHSSFEDSEQFKSDEPITSPHNSQVVKKIVGGIGTETYSVDLIRRGCATYRKTLVSKNAATLTPVKKKKVIRSRKQRSYERRSREVRGATELKFWDQITPEMMSDEESNEGMYIKHPPHYRSEMMAEFLKELDHRSEKRNNGSNRPRLQRVVGSPVKASIPSTAEKWMVKAELLNEENEENSEVREEETMLTDDSD